jgi:hypothetical protein
MHPMHWIWRYAASTIGMGDLGLRQTGSVLLMVFFSLRMRSCVRSGELAESVTGRAAGEGEGRSASASTKRGECQNGALMANRLALATARSDWLA